MSDDALSVEVTGETVGEAKWIALRELERVAGSFDRAAVRFQVVSEGERGLLGVGYEPARVLATVDRSEGVPAAAGAPRDDETDPTVRTRLLLERITAALGVSCTVEVRETSDAITAVCTGADLGLLIGRHGQTIDSIQYLANAIVNRGAHDGRKRIEVDAAGYRARREEALHREALRAAEEAIDGGREIVLEPMSAIERRVVHERLKDYPGVATASEGAEPHRYVVVAPA